MKILCSLSQCSLLIAMSSRKETKTFVQWWKPSRGSVRTEELVLSISDQFKRIGLDVESAESVLPTKSPQVHNLEHRLAVECAMSSELWPSLVFELHLGKFEEKVQAFMRCENGVEHSWASYHYGTSNKESVDEVVGRIFRKFVEPLASQSSVPLVAFRKLEFTPLPRALTARVDSAMGDRYVILERSSGRAVGAYMFRNFELFRSFHDELFDSSLMYFEPVSTHTFSAIDKLQISPADWVLLLQAWIARDVLLNFPYLEPNDFAFAEFGKQVRAFQRRLPSRFRNAYNSGLANWITRHDVSVRVKSREKWYPEGWQRDDSIES